MPMICILSLCNDFVPFFRSSLILEDLQIMQMDLQIVFHHTSNHKWVEPGSISSANRFEIPLFRSVFVFLFVDLELKVLSIQWEN